MRINEPKKQIEFKNVLHKSVFISFILVFIYSDDSNLFKIKDNKCLTHKRYDV